MYRSVLIDNLNIGTGARVLDMACGTGLNFNLLEKKIGSGGKITGIDNSAEALQIAKNRIKHRQWSNIETVKSDASLFTEKDGEFDASICTFAIEIIPPYRETIEAMIRLTKKNGRIGFIGFKYSKKPIINILNPLWKTVSMPFGGVDMDRNVMKYLENRLKQVFFKEAFGGFYYIAVYEKE